MLDYHWLFWFPAIITAIAAVAACFVVPKSLVSTAGKIGVAPAALLPSRLVFLLLSGSGEVRC